MVKRRDEIVTVLRQRVVAGLHLGVLKAGTRLPSVRTLASEFGIDPRVALAAYRELEMEGLVELRARSGIFVASTAASTGEMLPQMAEWVAGVLVEALTRGVPAIEFPERLRACLETVRLRAVCIECNADQITSLCNELEADYGLDARPLEVQALRSAGAAKELESADLLVTTPYHAADVQQAAERHGKPWITISLRPALLAETARLLERGPMYFVVKDPRFAEKLPWMFAAAPSVGNLRALVVGRDDLSSIPEGAPTYVMAAARGELEKLPSRLRLIPAPRVFSADSATALLRFVLNANIAALAAREAGAAP